MSKAINIEMIIPNIEDDLWIATRTKFSYELDWEKTGRVAIKEVLEYWSEEEVKEELKENSLKATRVFKNVSDNQYGKRFNK